MVKELKESFLSLTANPSVDGVILTGHTGAFSAGLDVVEQAQMSEAETHAFWVDYYGALQAMVRYPKPFVCAITGFLTPVALVLGIIALVKGKKYRTENTTI